MAPSVASAEGMVSERCDELIEEIRGGDGAKGCESHQAMADAIIQVLRICKLFLSYVESPIFKLLVLVVSLGGTSAIALAALKLLGIAMTGKVMP